jgi:hypothetical protein
MPIIIDIDSRPLTRMIGCAEYVQNYFRPGGLYDCNDLAANDK